MKLRKFQIHHSVLFSENWKGGKEPKLDGWAYVIYLEDLRKVLIKLIAEAQKEKEKGTGTTKIIMQIRKNAFMELLSMLEKGKEE